MNCNKCGAPLVENDKFCRNCGAAVNEINAHNMGNYNNSGYNQPQKNNTTKVLLISGIILLFIVLIMIVVMFFGMYLKESVPTNNNGYGHEDKYEDEDKNTNKNTDTPATKKESSYKVKFDGFTFKIPTDLVYEESEGMILIGDEDGTWASAITLVKGVYSQLSANKSQLQSTFTKQGFEASSALEKTINDMPCITLELSKNGQNLLIGYLKANSMNIFGIDIKNLYNEFDYDTLEIIASILNDAEYTGETNNMSTSENVDLGIVSNLAQ